MSVPITVNTVLQNVCGEHLDHTDFARPCANGQRGIKIAMREQLEGCKHLWLEQCGATTIMAQGHQRIERVETALHLTVIGFQRPKRQKHAARHPIVAFDPIKHGGVFFAVVPTVVHTVLANDRARKIDKRFFEHALRTVGLDHGGAVLRRCKKRIHGGCIMPLGYGFGFHALHERCEISTARDGGVGGLDQCQTEEGRKCKMAHIKLFDCKCGESLRGEAALGKCKSDHNREGDPPCAPKHAARGVDICGARIMAAVRVDPWK